MATCSLFVFPKEVADDSRKSCDANTRSAGDSDSVASDVERASERAEKRKLPPYSYVVQNLLLSILQSSRGTQCWHSSSVSINVVGAGSTDNYATSDVNPVL